MVVPPNIKKNSRTNQLVPRYVKLLIQSQFLFFWFHSEILAPLGAKNNRFNLFDELWRELPPHPLALGVKRWIDDDRCLALFADDFDFESAFAEIISQFFWHITLRHGLVHVMREAT